MHGISKVIVPHVDVGRCHDDDEPYVRACACVDAHVCMHMRNASRRGLMMSTPHSKSCGSPPLKRGFGCECNWCNHTAGVLRRRTQKGGTCGVVANPPSPASPCVHNMWQTCGTNSASSWVCGCWQCAQIEAQHSCSNDCKLWGNEQRRVRGWVRACVCKQICGLAGDGVNSHTV